VALADFSTLDGLWVALGVFFVLAGLGLAYVCVRLGATVGRLSSFITGLEREALPVVAKTGGTVDRVNEQLDKLDRITDSAVDAAETADGAVRVVANAVRRPVRKVSGFAAGVAHGTAAFKARHDMKDAYETARAAAARREHDLDAELDGHP
jgi:uncharacterized protein YoxC